MNMVIFQKRIQLIFLVFFPVYISREVNNREYTQSMILLFHGRTRMLASFFLCRS